MTNNQLAENSITQLLNSVKLARDNAERDDNRVDHSFYYALTIALEELQERRKAAMDSEPVAVPDHLTYLQSPTLENVLSDAEENSPMAHAARILAREVKFWRSVPLYRHAQPAPVVPVQLSDEQIDAVLDSNANMAYVIADKRERPRMFAREIIRAAMPQAGSDEIGSWANNKNTPASTPITPAAPDKKLTDDVLDEIIAGAKTSMEQYLALSLKAERGVWRKEGPTDDERIMAIEGIHNCERCGDEGWVVGEMGITRCACGQAGNSPEQSPIDHGYRPDCECTGCKATARICAELAGNYPVIPDGYVMVPKEPTEAMLAAAKEWTGLTSTAEAVYIKMLAAAPQEVNNG